MLIAIFPLLVTGVWEGVPYPIGRLAFTLLFMFLLVGAALGFIRMRFRNSLLADIATTIGIFLLIIGTIVYSVAFRGLRPVEMVFAWLFSGIAIYWFVFRMNSIMTRPLAHLERLSQSIHEGDWASLLASEGSSDAPHEQREFGSALRDVADLISETQRTAEYVLAASRQVTTIGAAAATTAASVATAATPTPAANTPFVSNEDPAHEATESAAREAQENAGIRPTVP
jgi:multisubunit Na+/H+ antiporter MnhG subunit